MVRAGDLVPTGITLVTPNLWQYMAETRLPQHRLVKTVLQSKTQVED